MSMAFTQQYRGWRRRLTACVDCLLPMTEAQDEMAETERRMGQQRARWWSSTSRGAVQGEVKYDYLRTQVDEQYGSGYSGQVRTCRRTVHLQAQQDNVASLRLGVGVDRVRHRGLCK